MDNLVILPAANAPYESVRAYWEALKEADTIKYRLCDIADPGYDEVAIMYSNPALNCFVIIDTKTLFVKGEFMLENFTGRSAQVHFSMHPDNGFKESIAIGTWANDTALATWKHPEGGPYVKSLFGLTPMSNRVACLFIQRCGYKKIGVLPSGITDRGEVVDAMISIRAGGDNGK